MAKKLGFRDGGKSSEEGALKNLSALISGSGVIGSNLAVLEDTPNDATVVVSLGNCFIGDVAPTASSYYYIGWLTADETLAITANTSGSARIDAVVAYVNKAIQDTSNSDNPDALDLMVVAGTPAGSPLAPTDNEIQTAIGAGNPFIRLANVAVANGFTSITQGNITDTRPIVVLNTGVANSKITEDMILNLAITAGKIASNAVTTTKILDANVTSPKVKLTFGSVSESVSGATNASWADIGTGLTMTAFANCRIRVNFTGTLSVYKSSAANLSASISIGVGGSGKEGTIACTFDPTNTATDLTKQIPICISYAVDVTSAGATDVTLRGILGAGDSYSIAGVLQAEVTSQ